MWDFEIRILFKARDLIDIVEGTETLESQTEESKVKKWRTKDAIAQHYILLTIENRVKPHILSCTSSKEMYSTLKKIYQRDTSQQKCSLLQDFYNFKFDKDSDLMGNISQLQNITYKLNKLDKTLDDTMVMTKILTVLPEEYKHFSAAWDSTSAAEKTLDNLKARLLHEETKIKASLDEGTLAFKVTGTGRPMSQSQGRPKFNNSNNIKCFNCNETGHFKNKCPQKRFCTICKKPNHTERECFSKQNKPRPMAKMFCKICKKTNHFEKDCYFRDKSSGTNSRRTVFLTEVKEIHSPVCLTVDNQLSGNGNNNQSRPNLKTFIIDSGCTPSHMTNDLTILSNVKESKQHVAVAKKDQSMCSLGTGRVESSKCCLDNVSYVPELSKNLMSVNAITQNGGKVLFTKNKVEVIKDNNVVLEGNKNIQGLYEVKLDIENTDSKTNEVDLCTNDSIEVSLDTKPDSLVMNWHRKLGHINFNSLRKLTNMSVGLPNNELNHSESEFCTVCVKAKQVRNPFNSNRDRATKPLHIIHTDIVGPVEPLTYDNKKYVLTVVDDYTHFCKVYLLKSKSEAFQNLKEYVNEAEAFFNMKAAKLRLDNGGEFISMEMKQWCKNKGIVLDYTVPHTPQLNGTAERMNRTLFEKARALIFDSNLPKTMWGEAILTSAYLLNRSPTVTINTTPAEKWYGKTPDLSKLQIFGSICYAKILGPKKKLDSRTKEAIFVGYSLNSYRLWDPINKKIFVSRDVVFSKEIQTSQTKKQINKEIPDRYSSSDEDIETPDNLSDMIDADSQNQADSQEPPDDDSELGLRQNSNRPNETNNVGNDTITEQKYNLRERSKIKRPNRYDDNGQAILTFRECMSSDDKEKWKMAIDHEKESLNKNNTWEIVDEKQALGKEILTSRWVFKIKDDGTYKARLVVRGCQQAKESLDFKDTFSPVVESSSLRVLLSIAAKENLHIQTFDVKTAFLYGELENEIYMRIPEGFDDEGKICRLNKALYGLKQAPSQWNKRLTLFLRKEGLIQLKSDQCIFKNNENDLYLAIHVDDGILMAKDPDKLESLQEKLKENFEMTSSKIPTNYLGMEIVRNEKGIFVTQKKYAEQVLANFNMTDCKQVTTPIVPEDKNMSDGNTTDFPYREAIGSLLYMTNKTRPDMAFAVNYESRFLDKPTKKDIQNIKRTLRYLKGTQDMGIFFPSSQSNDLKIEAFSDSDYAGDVKDRKSTSGYVLMFGGAPVIWNSRKQPIIALSTAEAEYISAADCCKEIKYVQTLISELTNKSVKITLNVDNQSAIKLIKSGQMNRKSKHIDIRYHYVSEQYHNGLFDIKYCCTDDQLADIFTKPLLKNKFDKFKNMLLKKYVCMMK